MLGLVAQTALADSAAQSRYSHVLWCLNTHPVHNVHDRAWQTRATNTVPIRRPAVLQVTGEDVDDFKRAAKQQIRPLLDRDRDPLSGEWIFAYLRPLGSDPTSKGARKACSDPCHSGILQAHSVASSALHGFLLAAACGHASKHACSVKLLSYDLTGLMLSLSA